MSKMKQIVRSIFCIIILMSLVLTGCGSKEGKEANIKTVGITMDDVKQWKSDGSSIKKELEKLGYEVDLKYAKGDAAKQTAAIRTYIENKVSCIVVAAVDDSALVDVLEDAKNQGIPVIAYEKLIKDTKAVNYYLGFDDKGAGMEMARKMETQFQLETAAAEGRTYTMELIAGDANSKNDAVMYDGIMQIMDLYIDAKVVKCTTDDSIKTAVGLRIDSFTVRDIVKDHTILTEKAVKMIQNVADGYEPEVNDIENYYNGKYIVPAYVCSEKVS